MIDQTFYFLEGGGVFGGGVGGDIRQKNGLIVNVVTISIDGIYKYNGH